MQGSRDGFRVIYGAVRLVIKPAFCQKSIHLSYIGLFGALVQGYALESKVEGY